MAFGGSCSFRIGSIFSHNSSGTRQMVGKGFSLLVFLDIGASFSGDHAKDVTRSQGFEIVSKKPMLPGFLICVAPD